MCFELHQVGDKPRINNPINYVSQNILFRLFSSRIHESAVQNELSIQIQSD